MNVEPPRDVVSAPAPAELYPPVSRSVLLRVVRALVGPLARVWYRGGRVEIGLQKGDRRAVVAIGDDAWSALRALEIAAQRDRSREGAQATEIEAPAQGGSAE